ncbi:MAG: dephospho-CoA kinase [Vicinamibacterales bacterium]|nr:dephospho-CoA kinase [Vicinamibacterales bacterium]
MGTVPARIGLTGGIGTGKSHVLAYLARHGVSTVDADDLARAVVVPGEPALEAVVQRFGAGVLDARGALDRKALARIAFQDADARRDLEAIIHPAVWLAVEHWFRSRHGETGVAAVPLLFETGHERDFDKVIVTSCSTERQVARVAARDGLSVPEVRSRLAAQMAPEERLARADAVIDTNGAEADTDRQVDELWRRWGLPALR